MNDFEKQRNLKSRELGKAYATGKPIKPILEELRILSEKKHTNMRGEVENLPWVDTTPEELEDAEHFIGIYDEC